ncbi:hypothetical protein WR25_23730 [Diploscapter pachys]|uniref:Uncharacterized protein n=1 Tax=Diploscapter pachys TaxID=2018661 RepID=A0A2A2KB86_9BILA|nr:hypothetical protein WR25_23730 [Diploscapter pachys]
MLAADTDHPPAHHLLQAHHLAPEQAAPAETPTCHGRADQVAEADDPHQASLFQYRQGLEGLVQVPRADADPLARQRVVGVVQVASRDRALGIAHAGQTVVEHGHADQDQRIEQYRLEQHRRGCERAQQMQGDRWPIGQAAKIAGEKQAEQRAKACTQPFSGRDVQRRREQALQAGFGTRGRHRGDLIVFF